MSWHKYFTELDKPWEVNLPLYRMTGGSWFRDQCKGIWSDEERFPRFPVHSTERSREKKGLCWAEFYIIASEILNEKEEKTNQNT